MTFPIRFIYDSSELSGRGRRTYSLCSRRTYSLCRICVFSLMISLALRSTCFSYKAVSEDCLKPVILFMMFTTRCNLFLSFCLTFPMTDCNLSS